MDYTAVATIIASSGVMSIFGFYMLTRQATINRTEDKNERWIIADKADKAIEQARESLFIIKTIHTLVNSNLTRVTERLLAALVAQRLLLENAAFRDMPNVVNAITMLDDEILALRIELGERIQASKEVEAQQRGGDE
jgi:hypothetical protein